MQWTSSVTTTDNVLIGTLTDIQQSLDVGVGMPLATQMEHRVVGVSRDDGHVVWSAPVHDDSFNSVVVGPDQSVYVPLLGTFSLSTPHPDFGHQRDTARYRAVTPDEESPIE